MGTGVRISGIRHQRSQRRRLQSLSGIVFQARRRSADARVLEAWDYLQSRGRPTALGQFVMDDLAAAVEALR